MFEFLQNLLPSKTPVQAAPPAQLFTMPAATAPVNTATAENDSPTETAGHILGATLSHETVTRRGVAAKFPVAGVTLHAGQYRSPITTHDNDTFHGGRIGHMSEGAQELPRNHATLAVRLSRPIEDYDHASLTTALQRLVAKIPALHGKIDVHVEKDKPAHYADVWAELKPILDAKHEAFSAKERAMITEFFEVNKGKDDAPEYYGGIEVYHDDGKVNVNIRARELPEDKNATVSTDEGIVTYFKEHHDALLAKVKEHVLSLKKADGLPLLQPHDLEALDMHIEATGWNIVAQFGTKPATDIDPTTHQKLTDVELAKKMTETPMAKIDTKQLAATFTQALLECSKELPPILPRIMDGHMLADVLKKRLHNDPALHKLIDAHPMFQNETQAKAAEEAALKSGKIKLGVPTNGETFDGKPELTLQFELPPGVSFEQLTDSVAHVAENKMQKVVDVSRQNIGQIGLN